MDDLQFYATPPWLVAKAWATFKDRDFKRVLEPSAGTGELAMGGRSREYEGRRCNTGTKIDVIEIDVSKHPTLREAGFDVVGLDFLQFESLAGYSHILANPPFNDGAAHVLKAFDGLWQGEVVMIINAETLRNPFSAERRRLCQLVAQFGSAEFIADAFMGREVQRQTAVEVALVHLIKPAEATSDWIGPLIESLAVAPEEEGVFKLPGELQLPNSFVENQVAAYRAAVRAMREAVKSQAVANHYARRIGLTMARMNGKEAADPPPQTGEEIRDALLLGHENLRDRAWTSVLRSTDTLQRLSSKVAKEAEAQFETIRKLDFNETNVRAFLLGIVQSQPQMQIDMAVDCFLQVTRHWHENTVFYKGWKSNTKHRACGWRMRTTRFILPGFGTDAWSHSLSWESQRRLADFDLVWAMLDGKAKPEVGLVDLFRNQFPQLKASERLSSSYFDVRYYRQAGTMHLFARDKTLVDRLNRLVGKHKGWLPPDDAQASKAFWTAYEGAEKFDAEVHSELTKLRHASDRHRRWWDHPARALMNGKDEEHVRAVEAMGLAVDAVLEKQGLLDAIKHEQATSLPGTANGADRGVQETLLLTAA